MEQNKQGKETLAPGGVSVATIFIILAITSIAVAIVFWGISLGRKYQASSIEKKLENVNDETAGMGEIDQKAKQIYAAEQNISNINASKNYWSVLLNDLANQTTKNVTLDQLASDDEGRLTLSGATVSYEALGKFMSSLRSSGRFDEVTLGSVTLTTEGTTTPISFSVVISPNGSALTKVETNKEE